MKYPLFFIIALLIFSSFKTKEDDKKIISFITDSSNIQFYWKDNKQQTLKSIQNLKSFTESKGKHLKFAMNGGMYKNGNSPQGLFIQDGKIITPIDTLNGSGNFYLKPNGIFYITKKNQVAICQTFEFNNYEYAETKFATQSGPMLVIDKKIHPAFKKDSKNLNIRNGVGILPNGKIIFAMSKEEVNFYEFAEYFKELGCRNALYLDGYVSRMYLPGKNWKQLDGNFGVIIGVEE